MNKLTNGSPGWTRIRIQAIEIDEEVFGDSADTPKSTPKSVPCRRSSRDVVSIKNR